MEQLQTIQKVFSDKLLRVPDYQRGYAWDERQWKDLVEDLEVMRSDQEHYTGTLVLHLDPLNKQVIDEEGKALKVYDVVDGQQRLTTVIVLLDCISKELQQYENKATLANGIRKNYIQIVDIENQEKARLTLNKDCHEFFVNNIIAIDKTLNGPQIKSHERLERAQKFFMKYLENIRQQYPIEFEQRLLDLLTKITNYLMLTVYKVPNASDVGVIFEVMNNRGKPLSEMEKVKNYLLYLASKIEMDAANELSEKINKTWAFIFQRLMESNVSSLDYENQLLRSSWLMAYNYLTKTWKGYSSIKEEFNLRKYSDNLEKLLNDLNLYVDILHQSCIAYCDVIDPNHTEAYKNFHDKPDLRRRLRKNTEKLMRIGNIAAFLPILMAARIKNPDDSDFYEELLGLCEKYSFRIYRLHSYRSNTGQSNFFRQGYELFKGRISKQHILRRIKSTLLYYSPADKFVELFQVGEKNWYHFYGLKYFLYEFEEHLSKGEGVQLPWEELVKKDKKESIEHILPQTPSPKYWKQRWYKPQRDLYTHDLGNLTLTFNNSVYGNKPFPEKRGELGVKNCYANSNLFMERELTNYSDWTEDILLERREKIVDWALQRWFVETIEVDDLELEDEENLQFGLDNGDGAEDLDGDDENQEDGTQLKRPVKAWSKDDIFEYFNYLEDHGRSTYCFFRVLASAEGQIEYDKVVQRIGQLLGEEFTGHNFAGVRAGITQRTTKKGKERLENLYQLTEHKWVFTLKPKYRKIVKEYFESNN